MFICHDIYGEYKITLRSVSLVRKIILVLDMTHFSIINLDRDISKFVLLKCIIKIYHI